MSQTNPIEFIEHFDSLVIASFSSTHKPHSSYAPFVMKDDRYYICISQIAKHTENLLNSKEASIMFIEDELEAKNSFVRKRVTLDVEVSHITREKDKFTTIMGLFKDKFGEKASIYEQMADFQLFELLPIGGRVVFGFEDAYDYKV